MDNFPEMPSSPSRGNKKNRRLQEAEAEGAYLLEVAKRYLLRPGVAGGLVGLGESQRSNMRDENLHFMK